MGQIEDAGPSTTGYGVRSPEGTAPGSDPEGPLRGPRRPGARALLEVLDRDAQPRQSFTVAAWPLRIGRALDNDVVLSDPHVAAHHLTIDATDADTGLALTLADTRNGALLGRKRLRGGESATLAVDGEPIDITLGRTQLRLRLPGHALAAELALAPAGSLQRRALPLLLAALLLVAGTLFTTWLDTDPENLTRAIGSTLLTGLVGAAIWCTVWALMSKTFTRQAHFGWHVRVFVIASLALLVVGTLSSLIAFAFSWPWLTDFDFVATIAVAAAALYFHLLAVEPAQHRLLKWAAAGCGVVGVALSLWFNVQRGDRLGEELYMNHLFPPALRLAKPVAPASFVDGMAALRPSLDKKAKEPPRGDEAGRTEDE